MSILSLMRRDRRASAPRRTKQIARYSPVVDCLEDRVVLSRASVAPVAAPPAQVAPQQTVITSPLRITDVLIENGQLIAVGEIAGQAFRSPVLLGLAEDQTGAHEDCPILNLELGALHLDLLGLNVDTSDICLRITAEPGQGNLLGNLLCGIAGLLDGGQDLGGILNGLDTTQTETLTQGVAGLLNGALDAVAGATQGASVTSTDILNLSLGPIDLNLLGLDVELDNCEGGPVTVDITAEQGSGKLLGNLLGGLSRLLDRDVPADLDTQILRQLGRIYRTIDRLADRLA